MVSKHKDFKTENMKHYLIFFLRIFIVAFLFMILSSCNRYLFRNGRSAYTIVIGPDASVSERTAAEELRYYIKEISGAELPITDDQNCRGKRVFIGISHSWFHSVTTTVSRTCRPRVSQI